MPLGLKKTINIIFSRLISAGCALDPGSPTVAPGITATGKKFTGLAQIIEPSVFLRYDEDEAKSNRDNQEASRSALQRYLFYCNRYG